MRRLVISSSNPFEKTVYIMAYTTTLQYLLTTAHTTGQLAV